MSVCRVRYVRCRLLVCRGKVRLDVGGCLSLFVGGVSLVVGIDAPGVKRHLFRWLKGALHIGVSSLLVHPENVSALCAPHPTFTLGTVRWQTHFASSV